MDNLKRIADRLAFLGKEEKEKLLDDHYALDPTEEEEDESQAYVTEPVAPSGEFKDDATAAGPHNEPNSSRYKLEPGHSQSLSDVLSKTAKRLTRLTKTI